ncbi:hypothetical protein C5167_025628 [Papaver somniferum]|uniref:F-box associated beta-propeller type 3 domain-containing protein n=2 Tax=Papaver somniferum TaxID=3469 RepID=A0A4Y7JV80_PAPSO|nr:hypothetical protein C5167_025628 [Papaver somniferum]
MKREYLNLPIQEEPTVCGFGYDTSAGVYKVVRMDPDRVTRGDMVHVYTVGSGVGWRRKENIAQMRCSRFGGFTGIPCNGALHWLDYKNRIWTFDLADEEFRCIPSPQFQLAAVNDHFELRLLGECLSLVHYKDSRTILDIWLLKRNDKERKRNNSTVNEKLDYYKLSSWNWSKEFSLTEVLCEHYDPVDIVDPFALTKNGELLLFSRTTTEVYRYTMKSTKSVYDKEKLNDGAHVRLYVRTAMPYKKSFVSLKDLGEDVKIFDLVTR